MLSTVNIMAIDHNHSIWNKEVPLKVSLIAWHLLQNRLPTKDNLIHIDIPQQNVHLCVGGYRKTDDVDHLFLNCDYFGNCWMEFCTAWNR